MRDRFLHITADSKEPKRPGPHNTDANGPNVMRWCGDARGPSSGIRDKPQSATLQSVFTTSVSTFSHARPPSATHHAYIPNLGRLRLDFILKLPLRIIFQTPQKTLLT